MYAVSQKYREAMARPVQRHRIKGTVNGKKIAFTHLFFMTKASYAKLGLKSPYVDIGAHRFFTKWVK